jgi:hypothetical protein
MEMFSRLDAVTFLTSPAVVTWKETANTRLRVIRILVFLS